MWHYIVADGGLSGAIIAVTVGSGHLSLLRFHTGMEIIEWHMSGAVRINSGSRRQLLF